ncbi:hypothetical protein A2164_02640 [Candidatus Curtissbacteria bacterium RBG_13_35_7]|uniref:Peptidase family U32 C-terminal domain-containing protein n=1 Tax=Candidatus Curtissbacteria bacterium RBG_13_35_7 TaxID=1797705 RepID=A0A1F5G291_9BACT|nr:MAG: hypothetical protein A2164_02640 [Candidatus Curtissbacteria bacterium RBG_13_35_7]
MNIKQQNVGTVTHYYDKIGVAVAKLKKGDIKKGDDINLIDKDGNEFIQHVSSMQIEHADIDIAKSGDEFGIKVDKPVKEGTNITKS